MYFTGKEYAGEFMHSRSHPHTDIYNNDQTWEWERGIIIAMQFIQFRISVHFVNSYLPLPSP